MSSEQLKESWWKKRKSHQVRISELSKPIPAQLPGPLDTWAGPGPKSISFKLRSFRDFELIINTLDAHESAPPELKIVLNNKHIAAVFKLKPGHGVKSYDWRKKGIQAILSQVVRLGGSVTMVKSISIVNSSGSWVGLDSIKIRQITQSWEYAAAGLAWLVFIALCLLLRRRREVSLTNMLGRISLDKLIEFSKAQPHISMRTALLLTAGALGHFSFAAAL